MNALILTHIHIYEKGTHIHESSQVESVPRNESKMAVL